MPTKPPPLESACAETVAPECDVIDTSPAMSSDSAALLAQTCAPNTACAVGPLTPAKPYDPPLAITVDPPVRAALKVRIDSPSGSNSLLRDEFVASMSKRNVYSLTLTPDGASTTPPS